MQTNNAREQIIAALKDSENILIALNNNPSVDELAAALALTLAINKTGKHATAVASGDMPDVLEFLNPSRTFENSVDSLRDFIIALNKDKADHLRYKLVGDHVKIFITPYKTVLTEQDLEFEQGDFNVDFVLALGVNSQDHLDSALAAHGRIFHDASVGVLTVGETTSSLSDLNWHEENASSLSEMVLELIESDSIGKKSLNKAVSTAILTGIVAETDRFSNEKTNAKVMNLASKLIMAGADQQLVVSKIRESEEKAAEINLRNDIETQAETIKNTKESANGTKKATPKSSPKKDASVLTIERDESSAEDELEQSLDQMSAAVAEEMVEKSPELAKLEALATDFPATATIPSTEAAPEMNFEAAPIEAEITPQTATVSAMPVQPPAEPEPVHILAPVENYAPEIPEAPAEFEQSTAFVAEQPVAGEQFQPATPEAVAQPAAEVQPAQVPTFGARDYDGDDYYHPAENRQLAGEVAQNPILSHDQPVNMEDYATATDQIHSPGLARGKDLTPPTLGMMAENAPATTDFANVAPQQPQMMPDFNNLPPAVPDFSTMPLPPELPPVPNFDELGFNQIPAPAPMFDNSVAAQTNFAENPVLEPIAPPEVAQGVAASANNVMTDQVYQDPAQFHIPGM